MPYIRGCSKEAVSKNIAELVKTAIRKSRPSQKAYSIARKYSKKMFEKKKEGIV